MRNTISDGELAVTVGALRARMSVRQYRDVCAQVATMRGEARRELVPGAWDMSARWAGDEDVESHPSGWYRTKHKRMRTLTAALLWQHGQDVERLQRAACALWAGGNLLPRDVDTIMFDPPSTGHAPPTLPELCDVVARIMDGQSRSTMMADGVREKAIRMMRQVLGTDEFVAEQRELLARWLLSANPDATAVHLQAMWDEVWGGELAPLSDAQAAETLRLTK